MYIINLHIKYYVKNNFDIFKNTLESFEQKIFIVVFIIVYLEYNTMFIFMLVSSYAYST